MKTFVVSVPIVGSSEVWIRAETAEIALRKAKKVDSDELISSAYVAWDEDHEPWVKE